ncbi:MAG: TIGR02266 family protein [Myxococcota bacterium]|jgi:uncharacterized protein (TIGR02266 family)|nr:TIGR02266 family protein [Myxococcota bacterium]
MTNDSRRDPRQPLGLKIRFKSATLNDFVEKHSRDLSRGGLFINMATPLPVGTLIKFDVRLEDDNSIFQGVGRVVWRREAVRDDVPPGMGVKFIKLDNTSRDNIETLLEGRTDVGPIGEAPVVEQRAANPSRPPQPIPPVRPQNIPKSAKRTLTGLGGPQEGDGQGEGSDQFASSAASSHSSIPPDFLAEIRDAIGDALDEPQAAKTSVPAAKPAMFDEGPTRVAPPSSRAEQDQPRVIVASSATERGDNTPTGVQSVDPAKSMSYWSEDENEYEKTIARPMISADMARIAEESESRTTMPPVSAPNADRPKPPIPTAPPKTPAAKESKPAAPAHVPAHVSGAPDRPTVPSPGSPTKSNTALLALGGMLILALLGLAFFLFVPTPKEEPGSLPPPLTTAPVVPTPVPLTPVAQPVAPTPETAQATVPQPPTPAPVATDAIPTKSVSFGLADIASSPPGATIFVAGESKGKAPVTIEGMEPGVEIDVTAKLFGYKTKTIKVTSKEDGAKSTIKLEEAEVKVIVESDPPGARVHLAGDWIGKTPRTSTIRGAGPKLEYKLQKPGYEDYKGTIGEADWTEAEGVFTAVVKVALTKLPTAEPTVTEPAPAEPKTAQGQTKAAKKPKTEPKPVTEEPILSSETKKPAPEETKPAPEVKKPAPEETKPAPEVKKPAPEEKKPAPEVKKPAPEEKKPAPEAKKPAPEAKKPAPEETKPAPGTKKPAVDENPF